jgi:hypothetical protein
VESGALRQEGIDEELEEGTWMETRAGADGKVFENEGGEEFQPHGTYTVSNTGGYEIMLSDDGEMARVKDAFGSDNPKISDWLEIEYVDDEETGEPTAVIDPMGYNIPLDQVMRINRGGMEGSELYESVDIEKTKDGYIMLSKHLKNGDLFKRKYMDYTEKEAKAKFKQECEKEEDKVNKLNEVVNRFNKIINY